MKYLIEKSNGSMSNLPEYIMKTDDDIYLNIPNLIRLLSNGSYLRYFVGCTLIYEYYFRCPIKFTLFQCSSTHYSSFKKNYYHYLEPPLFGSTDVLLDVMRPSEEQMESKDNQILPYIFSPYYMYNKNQYPQFLSGSGNFVTVLSLKLII